MSTFFKMPLKKHSTALENTSLKNTLLPHEFSLCKRHFLIALSLVLTFCNTNSFAQSLGLNNATPHASSILDLTATDRGLLVPRMTTIQRNAISLPATSLVVYNITTNQFNFYNGTSWVVWGNTAYLSVDAGDTLTTSSTADIVITGMTQTASEAGTFSVNFNSQVTTSESFYTTSFSTATGAANLTLIYNDIMALPVTNTTPAARAFGSGEVLPPGVYDIAGAASIAGTLTLDGGGDPNALFVIRASGAFNTGAGTTVNLINGATAKNVFWVAQGAIGIGATTTLVGTILSQAAVAVGANCTITGRLFSTAGAISFGPGTLSLPTGSSIIDFRTLSSFVIFTSSGGIANTGASTYNGDIGTNLGAITTFDPTTVNGVIHPAGTNSVTTPVNHVSTFSLYKNGVLIPNSSRTRTHLLNPSDISLQCITTVAMGDIVDVRWKIDTQPSDLPPQLNVINRILTLIQVGN